MKFLNSYFSNSNSLFDLLLLNLILPRNYEPLLNEPRSTGKAELTALFLETQTVDNLHSKVNNVVLFKTIILETQLKHAHTHTQNNNQGCQ